MVAVSTTGPRWGLSEAGEPPSIAPLRGGWYRPCMDELIRQLGIGETVTSAVTAWTLLIGCGLSFVLSCLTALLYRKTLSEGSYSQSFAHSLVLLSMITCLIMLIIGSNIARAFSLVGALSIIRFRSAIRSPFDVAFIFLAMAIGMACGTRFWSIAILGVGMISVGLLTLRRLNFASYPEQREFLLSVVFHVDKGYEEALEAIFPQYFEAWSVSYIETVRQGTMREVVYSVRPKQDTNDQELIDAIRVVNDNLKVTYRTIRRAIEVP